MVPLTLIISYLTIAFGLSSLVVTSVTSAILRLTIPLLNPATTRARINVGNE